MPRKDEDTKHGFRIEVGNLKVSAHGFGAAVLLLAFCVVVAFIYALKTSGASLTLG